MASGSGYALSGWVPLYPGVERAIGNRSLAPPMPAQWLNAIRIDLQAPGISFLSTPADQLDPSGVTVRAFLNANFGGGLQAMLAVNANFFEDSPGQRNTLYGLAYAQGQVVSSDTSKPYTLAIAKDNTASIHGPNDLPPSNPWTAVSGNLPLVAQGQNVAPDPENPEYAARTAVGLSPASGTAPPYLYILTVDGIETESGNLYGARLIDMAEWLIAAGATDGFNLDGGGSTTMARIDGGTQTAVLMNVPHGNEHPEPSERPVGNCFGVCVSA
jgi:hypothetical protein